MTLFAFDPIAEEPPCASCGSREIIPIATAIRSAEDCWEPVCGRCNAMLIRAVHDGMSRQREIDNRIRAAALWMWPFRP